MTTARDDVVVGMPLADGNHVFGGNPVVEGNPMTEGKTAKDLQTTLPDLAAPNEVSQSPTKKRGCSRVVLAMLAGAFVLAAAAATAVIVGGGLHGKESASSQKGGSDGRDPKAMGRPAGRGGDLEGARGGDLEDGSSTEGIGSGKDDPKASVPGIAGSLVLRANLSTADGLLSDGRFHTAIARTVASMLSAQAGNNITADAVKVGSHTRRLLGPAPSLRRPARRLDDEFETRIKYFVSLDGEGALVPEDAARLLVATDLAAWNIALAAEMASQGFEQDLAVEVIGITAEAAGATGAGRDAGGDYGNGSNVHNGGEGHHAGGKRGEQDGKNCSGGGGDGGRGHGRSGHN